MTSWVNNLGSHLGDGGRAVSKETPLHPCRGVGCLLSPDHPGAPDTIHRAVECDVLSIWIPAHLHISLRP